jgi:CubicO group peptidase (beta-lactamase class C family)
VKRRNAFLGAIVACAAAVLASRCGDSSGPSMPAPSGQAPSDDAPSSLTPAEPRLSSSARAALSSVLESAVRRGDAPGLVALVVDRDGVLFEGAAGARDVARAQAMPTDAIFSIASMTKPVTSVAAMMLYERGQLGLDDPVWMYLPEFAERDVARFDAANGSYTTEPSTTAMTVRHLLSHTSGIGYSFCNSNVARLQQDYPGEEWQLPLLDEPGTRWHYGPSTRVLGMLVEQISGRSLEEFFQTEIFAPLNMIDTSFAVPIEKQARLPTVHSRRSDGSLQESPQNGVPSTPTPPFTGDGGLYSTARDYGRFMRMFLEGGSLDGARILSAASVAMMGQNQIGTRFVEQQEAANPTLTRPFPLGAGSDKFGLGFQITVRDSGGAARSAGSLAWAGLFNTEFWIDPARGVAATLLMQVLPFYDEGAVRTLQAFEAALYRELPPASN